MSGIILIPRPRTHAAHWVSRFSLYRSVPVEFAGRGIGVTARNLLGVPGGAVGGGAVEVPTELFMRHIRWSVRKW